MKKIISIFALTILSINSHSAQSSNIKIDRIASQDDGTIILYSKNSWGSVANNSCSSGTGVLAFKVGPDGGNGLLSVALTAYSMQKDIIVTTYDDHCIAVGGMAPAIQRIDILN